ncbi:MAG: phage holin, LLH family [Candidatus Methanomethylicaceae archaeon]
MSELQPYFNQAVSAVIIAFAAFVAYLARRGFYLLKLYIETRVDEYQLRILKEMAKTIVRELQQNPVFENLEPEKKKEQAIFWLKHRLEGFGLEVDESMLSSFIEEAVQVMKTEFYK